MKLGRPIRPDATTFLDGCVVVVRTGYWAMETSVRLFRFAAFDHAVAFLDGWGHGLLGQHVASVIQCGNGSVAMHHGRRSNADNIHREGPGSSSME